jgi:hypothetical protein
MTINAGSPAGSKRCAQRSTKKRYRKHEQRSKEISEIRCSERGAQSPLEPLSCATRVSVQIVLPMDGELSNRQVAEQR